MNFLTATFVNSIEFKASVDHITANSLEYVRDGKPTTVEIEPDDLVLVTNGSQTADLSLGSMTAPETLCLDGRSCALEEVGPWPPRIRQSRYIFRRNAFADGLMRILRPIAANPTST